tara:strand:+ start:254 stop:436 length:183 start_codon:yes stop_codon:yes gene_type:complete
MSAFSKTKGNLKRARTLTSGGILIGGKDKKINLKRGEIVFKNIYGKSIPKIKVNRRSRNG